MSKKAILQGYLLRSTDTDVSRPIQGKDIRYHPASITEYIWIQITEKKEIQD